MRGPASPPPRRQGQIANGARVGSQSIHWCTKARFGLDLLQLLMNHNKLIQDSFPAFPNMIVG